MENKSETFTPFNCYVACLDILGLKAAMQTIGAVKIAELYAIAISLTREQKSAKHVFHSKDGKSDFSTVWFKNVQHVAVFSDSIFAFTKDDSDDSLINICEFCNLLFHVFLDSELPLRGAIARGEVVLDADLSLFLGQGIIDAFLLEESLKIVGIVLQEGLSPSNKYTTTEYTVVTSAGAKVLRVPVLSPNYRYFGNEEKIEKFKKMREKAGESQKQRYENSLDIAAGMLNLEKKQLE